MYNGKRIALKFMNKRKSLMSNRLMVKIGLTSTLLILTACNSQMTVEDVNEATNEINSSYQDFIKINNELNSLEEEMNPQFEEALAEDENLGTISDDSADVVKNIDERQALIENNDEQLNLLIEQAEKIGEYDGDDLPEETLQQLSQELLTFSKSIKDFQTEYLNSLEVQRNYLTDIAGDEADYESFGAGIENVNENYFELQEFISNLDAEFVEANEQITELQELTNQDENNNNEVDETENSENKDDNEDTDEQATEDDESETDTEVEEDEADTAPEKNEDSADAEDAADDNGSDEELETELEEDVQILAVNSEQLLNMPDKFPQKFVYDSGVDIPYPKDGVKGIYVTSNSAGGGKMDSLVEMINSTDLNTMVIDIKDDYGNITIDLDSDNELVNEMTNPVIDAEELMTLLDENDIYPIARIVVFKDSLLAEAEPDWSFTKDDGSVWVNRRGESFVNPYMKEVWDYNIEVAVQAAKLGFKDIQFDYVRFPEGFENRDKELNYSHGHFASDSEDVISMEYRNRAVTEFVRSAKESLMPYGADLSVDIFGYAAVVRETPGIGQSFPGIAKEVDVISSMIYPSHWGPGNLDISKPDLEPYKVVDNYMKVEEEVLAELGDDAPSTRPWLQDFTASYLGAGNYKNYGTQEVNDQIRALADNGIHEFLLWNAGNTYSEDATFIME